MEFFTFSEPDFDLCPAVFEINRKRNDRIALFFNFSGHFQYFVFVKEELSFAFRIMVEPVALFVGADVEIVEPDFAVFDFCKAVFRVYGVFSYAL